LRHNAKPTQDRAGNNGETGARVHDRVHGLKAVACRVPDFNRMAEDAHFALLSRLLTSLASMGFTTGGEGAVDGAERDYEVRSGCYENQATH
jgi:hypothetical protein